MRLLFDPLTITIEFSPFGVTKIGATPENSSLDLYTKSIKTPFFLKFSNVPAPNDSSPTLETITTLLPSFAAIIAWLAPLPP